MCAAFECEAEPTKPNHEQVSSCIMATSEVDLKWILFIIIIAKDDNNDDNKDMKSWNESGNIWYNGCFGFEMNKYCNGFICDRGLVWDDINIEYGVGDIIGANAAPDGVAIQIIFVYWEGGVGGVLFWHSYGSIWRIYLLIWIEIICDIIKRGEGQRPPIKAEPISPAEEEGKALFGVIVSLYVGFIIVFYVLCVGCVETRLG